MPAIKLADSLTDLLPEPDFSSSELRALQKRDLVKRHEIYVDDTGNKAGKGIAYMLVKATPKQIWEVIADFSQYHKFYPSVAKCQVYSESGNEIWVQFNLKVALIIKIQYHIYHEFFPTQSRLVWKVDQSKKNDIKESIGSWTAWPRDDGTSLVEYSASIESGRPVPQKIESMVAEKGLNGVMEHLRKRVESGGRFTK